tara:strand:+ start:2972 stop:3550 length:579 start_codon:yes stop_codon:yes gene_type:complete
MSFMLLGILNSQAAGGGGGAFDLLETYDVTTTGVDEIDFTGLSSYSDYQHLQLRYVAGLETTDTSPITLLFRLNSDSGSNYAWHHLMGNSGSVTSSSGSATSYIQLQKALDTDSDTSDQFGAGVVDFLDFSSTNKNTTLRGLFGSTLSTDPAVALASGLWNNTAAVTTINIIRTGLNFAVGSRFSIYGTKGA